MKKLSKNITILAIETSCDETAAAVLQVWRKTSLPKTKTLSSVIKSQIRIHSNMGGVVPEAAARAHVKNILPVTKTALAKAKLKLADIDYFTVTTGPGLIPSLLIGVEFIKGLSFALNKPIIPVNHLLGHLYSPFTLVKDKRLRIKDLFPQISLIVSGGHTILVLVKDTKTYQVLGQTLDDAAGEAFDKVAKLLELPYPGGPQISKFAKIGRADAINFPRPMIHAKNYNFSFAGLKTSVLYYVKDKGLKIKDKRLRADICASFQQAAIDVLIAKTLKAALNFRAKSVSLSGGVSANIQLRGQLRNCCKKNRIKFLASPLKLSTDNAEMIGLAAAFMLNNGFKPISYKSVKTDSNLQL